MQKISRTNLNNRLPSRNKHSQKERNSKNLFSQRRLSNLGLSEGLTKTIEFLHRESLSESLVHIGTVAGFRGIRGDIYVRFTMPVWELFGSRGKSNAYSSDLQFFFD